MDITRDGSLPSIWQSMTVTKGPQHNITDATGQLWDVLIVGGGITGLTTAIRLQEAGMDCIVVEAHRIGFGTTGGTTAHINTMLDTPYHTIENDFGEEGARLVATAAKVAIAAVDRNVSDYRIDCDFNYKDGVLFAETDDEAQTLEKIYTASRKAGVAVEWTDSVPIPVHFRQAIRFPAQVQLHPLKYLYGLADRFIQRGGVILENTRAEGATYSEDQHQIKTSQGLLRARRLVYATHIPPGVNILHFRCAPYRSYVLAAQLEDDSYPNDLVYDMQDPYHYFRTHVIDGTPYLIAGGADHKTGHGDPVRAFRELRAYVYKHFRVSSIDYQWSAQYFEPADGLPYIGKFPGSDDDTYVATGFGGNGILFGSFSGVLVADMILGEDNPFQALFSPSRVKPVAGFASFVKENADVAYRFVADRVSVDKLNTLTELPPGTGAVVNYENQQVALYKSPEGATVALSPVCKHAGCIVVWNDAEKSWDCPCHGGRYDPYGKVLSGPPRSDLQEVRLVQA
jgi:Glycine/D-amino acid oxidases (deaminating)